MKSQEFETYFRKCEEHGVRIYGMTVFEAERSLLEAKKEKFTASEYYQEVQKLEVLKTSKNLRICIETNEEKSIGNKIFTIENVHQQIELLYKLKSEKLTK